MVAVGILLKFKLSTNPNIMKPIHVNLDSFQLKNFEKFLEDNLSNYFQGSVTATIAPDDCIEYPDSDSPPIQMEIASVGDRFFLPFTSPDTEGGMLYGDGSKVVFDDEDECFSDADCYGYALKRQNKQWSIEIGLCAYNGTGPCICHHFELVITKPLSRELWSRMESTLEKFIDQ